MAQVIRVNIADESMKVIPAKYNKMFLTMFTNPKYKHAVLMPFIKAYLKKPDLDPKDVEISDPHLPSDSVEEKHPIVDVFITMPTEILHIEMQFIVSQETLDRFYFYHTKAFGGQLPSGKSYRKLKRVISLFILTQPAIDDDYYLHVFKPYDEVHGITMTQKAVNVVLELSKLPEESDGSTEWIWGSLFEAEEEAQLNMLETTYPEVSGAVKAIKELSADPQFRREAFLIEKAKNDWLASIMDASEDGFEKGIGIGAQKGKLEMARNLLATTSLSLDIIASAAGLPLDVMKRELNLI
ncbi:hypothetical protein AGMMS49992_29440 [Clostridia bacterium]|nr:hypothetical protein AGMMS49992_29440 [Clostridia bacterium]